ncbi:MAG: hypothetical protein C5B48_00645 [Candidatus Rokuibacteriota bacterium]|nr:MAG: hypothetical protein C5B48_00645 [Candidatus Rokubacteria bacterium]
MSDDGCSRGACRGDRQASRSRTRQRVCRRNDPLEASGERLVFRSKRRLCRRHLFWGEVRKGVGAPSGSTERGFAVLAIKLRSTLIFVCLLGLLVLPRGATAARSCGGDVVCKCGDTVTASYALPGDLGPCPGHGLTIKSGVRLDCRGFKITGSSNAIQQYGVFLDGKPGAEVTGATVKACHISGFMRGIRLRAASESVIADNVTSTNGDFKAHVGYGIDLSGESRNNILQGNTVRGNADEGIHVGRGSHRNRLSENVATDNFRESLYVLASNGGVFLKNTLGGTGVNSLYLKDSSSNHFEGNTFIGKTVRIIGDSHDNEFIGNTFSGTGLHFLYYKEAPERRPTNNRVTGGSIRGASDCLRFTSSSGNVVADTVLTECRTRVRSEAPEGPAENTLIGIDASTVSLGEGSVINLAWRLTMHVEDARGVPLAGAQVLAKDATGTPAFTAVTDESGNIPPQVVIASSRTDDKVAAKTPYTIETSKPGYRSDMRTVPIVEHVKLTVSLESQ